MSQGLGVFAQKVLIATGIPVVIVALLFMFTQALAVLLLAFAAILLAVFLRQTSALVSRHTRLPPGWSLTLVMLLLLALAIGGGWLVAPKVAEQIDQLTQQLPQAIDWLRQRLGRHEWARDWLLQNYEPRQLVPEFNVVGRITGVFSVAVTAAGGLILLLFLGLFLAAEPDWYVRGIVRLFPLARRARIAEVLGRLGEGLWMWLLGRILASLFVGVLTVIGLLALDMPLAFTLGLIAFVLNFIPNIGPILSGVPAVLLALLQSPMLAVYVIALYLAIQTVESYIVTPMIQRRVVSLPPALTLTAQLLLASLIGFLGLFLATPLTVVAMVLIEELYIKDVLGEREEAEPD